MTTLDEIEAAADMYDTFVPLPKETVLALCADLKKCADALAAADATIPYDGHINDMARSVVSGARQNLKKWGL